MTALRRVAILAASALLCGSLSALVALDAYRRSLDPSDGAYGISLPEFLADPFVWFGAVGLMFPFASLGYLFSLSALARVRLSKAVPVTIAATVATVAVVSQFHVLLSVPSGWLAGLAAMQLCRRRASWSEAEAATSLSRPPAVSRGTSPPA